MEKDYSETHYRTGTLSMKGLGLPLVATDFQKPNSADQKGYAMQTSRLTLL